MATVDEILTRQAYTAGDETWTKDNNYPSYHLYVEPEYVPVTNKRIADFNDQISVRGEQNAQFVGILLPRYDDGLDLTAAHLYIHYQTVYGGGDSVPCNVSWSDNYVRMCWQVPAQATQEPDRVQMMIYATGTNSAGERVTWKTLPASYTIHDGLDIGGGIPEPDPSWYEQFVAQMEAQVSTAQGHADDAQANKIAAAGSAKAAAESAAASAQALEDNKAYVESQKETFVGYNRRETDTKYANALVGSASGMGGVSIGDAWEAPVAGMDISGRSEQMVTTGAQLLDIPSLPARTSYGITFTPNPDGTILATGTATNMANFYLGDKFSAPAGDYCISGCPEGGRFDTFVIRGCIVSSGGTWGAYANDIGSGASWSVGEDKSIGAYIFIGTGISGPLVFKPMLNAGSTPKPWEPYTGGKPSPSPDYTQPIISTGTVTTGAQLLVYPFYNTTKTQNGITFTALDDGRISIKGTVTGNNATYILQKNLILPPGTYTKNNPGTIKFMISRYLNGAFDRAEVSQNDVTFNTDDWDYDVYEYKPLLQTVTVGDTFDNLIVSPMLNAGVTAKPWEPYTGGKPSPSPDYPQTIDVMVTGAQLFDSNQLKSATVLGIKFSNNGDGSFTLDGTSTGYANISYPISLPPETYSVSGGNNLIKFFVRISKNGQTYTDHSNSFTINGDEVWVRVFIQVNPNLTVSETIYPMLNAGSTALPWQPYQSCTATITLTEPLHGIGDYRDRIMCRDGEWGIERKYNRMIFDGSEDEIWNDSTTEASDKKRYNCKVSGRQADIRHQTALCSHFRLIETGTTFKNVCGFTIANDYIQLYLDGRPINEFKAWLQENPTTLVYQLSTPTCEPLPAATQSALNALTTYKGVTHVTVTAGGPEPDVGLGYVQDTRAVVADLQAQINAIRNGGTT